MGPKNFVTVVIFLSLLQAAHASFMLTIEGKVESLDENFVTIRKEATLIKVPRRSIQSHNVRPGQTVTSIIDAKSTVETWAQENQK